METKSTYKKKTLVIGASIKPERYSNKAMKLLAEYGHEVIGLAKREGSVDGIPIQTTFPVHDEIHTVTLYVGPAHQHEYHNWLLELKPQRVIFNPGTESDTLKKKLEAAGIEAVEGCTLVMLRYGYY